MCTKSTDERLVLEPVAETTLLIADIWCANRLLLGVFVFKAKIEWCESRSIAPMECTIYPFGYTDYFGEGCGGIYMCAEDLACSPGQKSQEPCWLFRT